MAETSRSALRSTSVRNGRADTEHVDWILGDTLVDEQTSSPDSE